MLNLKIMKAGLKLVFAGLFLTFMSCEKSNDTLVEENDFTLENESLATADYQYDNFVELTARDPKHKGRKDSIRHGRGGEGLVITFEELPQAAQDYITANSSKDLVRRIVKVTDKDGVVRYIVALTDGTHLFFDADGNFIEKRTRDDKHMEVLFGDLPQLVQDSINAKFDTSTIVHYYKVTLRDGKVIYVFRLADGTRVAMDETGAIVAEPKRKRRK